ncbi:MAG: protein kinase, partial [Pyrinomonadaceae bacterium]
MSTGSHERDEKESSAFSEGENKARAGTSADEKTLLRTPTPAADQPPISNEKLKDPTRNFAASSEAQTALQNAPDTEPTKIFSDKETDKETDETEIEAADAPLDAPNENALRPSRWRFALVCLLFVNMFIFAGINIYEAFLIQSIAPYFAERQGDNRVIVRVSQGFENELQVGDELVSISEIETNPTARQLDYLPLLENPGERLTVIVRRNGQVSEVETVSVSPRLSFYFNRVLFTLLFPAMFGVTGLLIFLLKPNAKQALLLALSFALIFASGSLLALNDLPPILLVVKVIGLLFNMLSAPLFLHFCLVFPERSTLLRRFPKLERLIYLPYLLIILPISVVLNLQFAGYSTLTALSAIAFLVDIENYTVDLYALVGLLVLIFTYRQFSDLARRKLRVILVGLLCASSPILLTDVVLKPMLGAFEILNPWQEWMPIITFVPLLLVPPVFAYAIVRHKVIPVSFVIRRGLQYLLAKNALRLLLILPILGIVWNIAANPNRTLSEILLNNSFAFYSFLALAAGFFLLMRSRFSDWIDRRFFREQYNQERVLHELIEDVKDSDSMSKLSRLVSNRIQSALHPTSVYLFYEDKHESDFSVGYTTSQNSDDLKLAADSPLLRFMQTQHGAIEFPLRNADSLPRRERDWLQGLRADLLVPMHGTDGKLAGFFSLGGKKSEIPYTQRDRELLETLANQIALVQENLSLKDRVRHEQKIKIEVLSRFDEGNINLLKECPRCGKCFDRTVNKCNEDGAELTFTLPVERTIENRYRLERLIGKGGMGAVYEATDTRINRTVAVKIVSGAMFGNRDALRRFEREAQTAGRLQHPNIITVFDYGVLSTEGAFLVMELFRGDSLRQILEREGKLDARTVVAWFGQVLDGVEAAHRQGIIHRDLKPDNILVSRGENGEARLCILDFGLARLNEQEFAAQSGTVPGTIMGTFGYMPPEQLRGEKTDERSDLFAVGVMIYEALHGEKLFRGNSYQELMRAMTNDEFLSELDSRLTEFFEKSLAQEPAARFASAGEM